MEQRAPEWFTARCGKITASRFSDVLTSGRGKEAFGKTAMGYAYEVVAEIMTGEPRPNIKATALEWGTENEPLAIAEYEEATFCKVHPVGYVAMDEWIGGSPDGLIGDRGGVEIKCPYNSAVHLTNVISQEVPAEYLPQVQGYMMITGRDWWDFVSYDPRYRKNMISIVRVNRDDKYIEMLKRRLADFRAIIETILRKVG